jgi:hypothetical protein
MALRLVFIGSSLDSKYRSNLIVAYLFLEKPIAEKLISVQTVNAKCGVEVFVTLCTPDIIKRMGLIDRNSGIHQLPRYFSGFASKAFLHPGAQK